MSYSADPITDVGKLRLLCTDRRVDNVIFQDEDYTAFLSLEGSNLKRTAALALETIATDQVLVLKVMTTLGVQTNGQAVASAILARAKVLRDSALFDENNSGAGWDIAEFVLNNWQADERLVGSVLRGT
jgi:hypothetical protein